MKSSSVAWRSHACVLSQRTSAKFATLAALCILMVVPLHAESIQTWNIAGSMTVHGQSIGPDGDVYHTGSAVLDEDGLTQIFVSRQNPWGGTVWAKTYEFESEAIAHSIRADREGNLWVVGKQGQLASGLPLDMLIMKLDGQGSVLWARTVGGDERDGAADVAWTESGDAIVVGHSGQSASTLSDLAIVNFDGAGTMQWASILDGEVNWEEGYVVKPSRDGGFLVGGSRFVPSESTHLQGMALKIDGDGQGVWQLRIEPPSDLSFVTDLEESSNGDVMVALGEWVPTELGANNHLIRLDAEGQFLWNRGFTNPVPRGEWMRVRETESGFLVSSTFAEASVGSRMAKGWLAEVDDAGGLVWQRRFDGAERESTFSRIDVHEGTILASGTTWSQDSNSENHPNGWLLRADANGEVAPGCSLMHEGEVSISNPALVIHPEVPRLDPADFVVREVEAQVSHLEVGIAEDCAISSFQAILQLSPDGCDASLDLGSSMLVAEVLSVGGHSALSVEPASLRLEGAPAIRCTPLDLGGTDGSQRAPCTSTAPDGRTDLLCLFDTAAVKDRLCTRGIGSDGNQPSRIQLWGSTKQGEPFLLSQEVTLEGDGCGANRSRNLPGVRILRR